MKTHAHPGRSYRAANSFSNEEVRCMVQLFDKLTRKGDVSTLVRNPAFASVARKFLAMRDQYQQHEVEATLGGSDT